jgi:hypothetical protein
VAALQTHKERKRQGAQGPTTTAATYSVQGLTAAPSHTGVSFLHTVAGSCLASCSMQQHTRLEPLTGTRARGTVVRVRVRVRVGL